MQVVIEADGRSFLLDFHYETTMFIEHGEGEPRLCHEHIYSGFFLVEAKEVRHAGGGAVVGQGYVDLGILPLILRFLPINPANHPLLFEHVCLVVPFIEYLVQVKGPKHPPIDLI